VGDGDGGVASFSHEEEGHGFADDHGATDDDGFFAGGVDVGGFEEFDTAGGSAGDKAGGVFEDEFGDVFGVEAVDVFGGVDGTYDGFFINVGGRRRLDEDAVDRRIVVEAFDDLEEFFLGGFGREGDFFGVDAEVSTGADFRADVDFRGGVFTDEDDGEAWSDAFFFEGGDLGFGVF